VNGRADQIQPGLVIAHNLWLELREYGIKAGNKIKRPHDPNIATIVEWPAVPLADDGFAAQSRGLDIQSYVTLPSPARASLYAWCMKLPIFRRQTHAGVDAVAPICLSPIAYVQNRIRRPQVHGWEKVESVIQVAPEQPSEMLSGLDGFSHVIVLFLLDRLGEDRPRPAAIQVGDDPTPRGVLATRTQLRPNPVGIAVVRLLSVAGNSLRVRGLDALDGTPVLDIKPYIPFYDSVADAAIPAWVDPDASSER
jgi:tRNA-Thr(GGU) m(6)t(6)A37 methyltransferase TsaA